MNQAQKECWITALRSGDYPQATSTLLLYDGDYEEDVPMGYCCLGVAACLFKLEHTDEFVSEDFLPQDVQSMLAELNDGVPDLPDQNKLVFGSNSFELIADYIERYVEASDAS